MSIELTAEITSIRDRLLAIWSTTRQGYKTGMLEIGGLLHEYLKQRLQQGDAMNEQQRRAHGITRMGITKELASTLGTTVLRVNDMLSSWACVHLLSDNGNTGSMPYSILRLFRPCIGRSGVGTLSRSHDDGGTPASEQENWVVLEPLAVGVFQQAVAEDWKYARIRTEIKRCRGKSIPKRHTNTKNPDVLTTGQVATILAVSSRTVTKMCDSGKLPSYRIPGSADRRVLKSDLMKLMTDTGMPESMGMLPSCTIAFGLHTGDIPPDGTAVVDCPFELGLKIAPKGDYTLLASDAMGNSYGVRACELVKREHPNANIIYVMPDDVGHVDLPPGVIAVRRPVDLRFVLLSKSSA